MPADQDVLVARRERNNPHDRYAIAAFKRNSEAGRENVVGHLPKEISRFTWFITSKMIYHRGGEPERAMHC